MQSNARHQTCPPTPCKDKVIRMDVFNKFPPKRQWLRFLQKQSHQSIEPWRHHRRNINLIKPKWVFPKIGVPENGWFIMENIWKTLSKRMIWGYPYFWKPPNAFRWKHHLCSGNSLTKPLPETNRKPTSKTRSDRHSPSTGLHHLKETNGYWSLWTLWTLNSLLERMEPCRSGACFWVTGFSHLASGCIGHRENYSAKTIQIYGAKLSQIEFCNGGNHLRLFKLPREIHRTCWLTQF